MTIDALEEVYRATPLVPFVLLLADGQEVWVDHPECLSFRPEKPRTIAVALPNSAFKIIDLLMVVALEVGKKKTRRRRQGNGRE